MDRRHFLRLSLQTSLTAGSAILVALPGCRGRQVAHVLDDTQGDMVGSHAAGAETYNRLVDESVSRLLGRQHEPQDPSLVSATGPKRICFIGVENKSSEEIGDFKEQLYQQVDAAIASSEEFRPVNRRYVDAGLQLCHLRPEHLLTPDGQRAFVAAMEQQGQPFDYLMYAVLTSGTTVNNSDKQRDYQLVIEIVNIHDGSYDKEIARVRKGYHKSHFGKWRVYNPFTSQQ